MKRCKLAMIVGAVLATTLPSTVFAAEVEEEKVEEDKIEYIQVTGSRIQRTDLETVKPVSIISAEDIAATGLNDIAAVLAQSNFNSSGSNVGASNNSAGNFSSSNLRGLGSNRTLTLVNGRRVAGAASLSGSSTNLNMIPLEAVERIEILRDGASSIYGSDAMGGVINIITKSDFEGLNISANVAIPTRGGAEDFGGSMTFGSSTDKSSLMFIIEHQQQRSLKGGERDHLDSEYATRRYSSRYSPWGSYWDYNKESYFPGPNCPEENIYIRDNGQKTCGYDVMDGKTYLPERQKTSMFSNFSYQLTDDLEFYTTVLYTYDKSFTSASPMWAWGDMAPDNPNNPTYGTADESWVEYYSYLQDSVPREFTFDSHLFDINTGLIYTVDAGTLSMNLAYSQDSFNQKSEYYLIADKFKAAVDNGDYNPFEYAGGPNATKDVLDSFRHTQSRNGENISQGVVIDWAAALPFELPAGEVGYSVGVEYRDIKQRDEQDSLSNSGNVVGAYGGDVVGGRQYRAAFLEVEVPLHETVTLTAATRYDDYSLPDQGQLSSSAGIRFQPFENLVLRTSYSEGFRVASVEEVTGAESVGYFDLVDPKYCNPVPKEERAESDLCDTENIRVRYFANPEVEPETSAQISAGFAWDIIENIDLTVDYWTIEIENEITSIGARTILDEEYLGNLGNYSGLYVNRDLDPDATREITEIGSTVTNYLGSDKSGVDLSFNSKFDMDAAGELTFRLDASLNLTNEFQKTREEPVYDYVGYWQNPEYRATFNAHYRLEDLQAYMNVRYVDGFLGESPVEEANGEDFNDVGSMITYDFGVQYQFADYGDLSLILINAFDNLPEVNDDLWNGYLPGFHSITGRTVQMKYSITF